MSTKRMVQLIEFCDPDKVPSIVARQMKEAGFTGNEIRDAGGLGFLEMIGSGKEGTIYRVSPHGRACLRNHYENDVWWKGFSGWLLLAIFAGIGAITGIIALFK
jgi:hypothetical protein